MSEHDHTPPADSRPIPFAHGYQICDGGEVWSCHIEGGRGRFGGNHVFSDSWHVVRPGRTKTGYLQAHLSIDGRKRSFYVHRLVLEIFVGPCPPGFEACHNDGDPANNFASNLRWDSKENNCADRKRHGTEPIGERHGCAKLKDADIPAISRLSRAGISQRRIAEIYGVSQTLIGLILRRRIWRHVPIAAEDASPLNPAEKAG